MQILEYVRWEEVLQLNSSVWFLQGPSSPLPHPQVWGMSMCRTEGATEISVWSVIHRKKSLSKGPFHKAFTILGKQRGAQQLRG